MYVIFYKICVLDCVDEELEWAKFLQKYSSETDLLSTLSMMHREVNNSKSFVILTLCEVQPIYLFCFARFGTLLVRKDSKALELPSIVVLTAVFLFMMLIRWNPLTTLTIGGKNSLFRYIFICLNLSWKYISFGFSCDSLFSI